MRAYATRARHSSSFLTATLPPATSDHHVQLPALRIEPPESPTGMSLRRLSWRRRQDMSTSSQPSGQDATHTQPQLSPLHRSMSELSPISPLTDRGTFVDEHGRRFSRMGFSRRQRSEDSALISPRHDYMPYHQQYQRPENPRLAPTVRTSFVDVTAGPPMHTTTSWPMRVDSMAQSYGLQPSYMGVNPLSHDPYGNEWNTSTTSPSQDSSGDTFMTSPTSYTGSSYTQFERRPLTSARLSRPVGTLNSTYPPVTSATYRRESEGVDEFTSPTDFALFAEATSSLDISPMPSPNLTSGDWPQIPQPQPQHHRQPISYMPAAPYAHPAVVSPTRLAAPLPPLPNQPRSRSSPAAMAVRRQPSRQEMIAEALAGLDLDDERGGSDDDELPNYEQSQAEVAAAKRREATARARELDEAWSRARRRGG